jgi:hypothetical protein
MIVRIRADSSALSTETVLCRLGLGPAAPRPRGAIKIGVLNWLSVEQTFDGPRPERVAPTVG